MNDVAGRDANQSRRKSSRFPRGGVGVAPPPTPVDREHSSWTQPTGGEQGTHQEASRRAGNH
jgi:hypothetical protein